MTGEYHGYRGLEKFLADNAETFELFEAGYDDIRELPDGRVFAAGNLRVRGVGSKLEQIVSLAGIATFRDGLWASWYDYGDRTKALAEAGLSECPTIRSRYSNVPLTRSTGSTARSCKRCSIRTSTSSRCAQPSKARSW